jgi:SWI/SNF-related matrix-associated actin-dependent regulator of chromatin subfamily A protein 2/4
MKSEVADQLPEKYEYIISIPLSGWQHWLYERIQKKMMVVLDKKTGQIKNANLQNTIMQLRKVNKK